MANPKVRVETAETEAVGWHERLGAPSVTSQEIEDFFAWRKAAPANADAYRRVELIWGQSAKLKGDADIGQALNDAMTRRMKEPRVFLSSPVVMGMASLGAAVVLAIGGWFWWQGQGSFVTGVGEQKIVQLADGSSVRLDTASRIRVRFDGDRRVVDLEGGQAMFEVAHDTSRPFVVQAGNVRVTAVGTVFDVRREPTGASVTLVSGVVDVASGRSEVTPTRMTAGNRAVVGPRGPVVRPVDVAIQTSWTDGRIVFRDTPLRMAVAEVNRYLTAKVELEASGLDDVLVNGVFKTGDREAFVSTTSEVFDLQASRSADGTVRLSPRPK